MTDTPLPNHRTEESQPNIQKGYNEDGTIHTWGSQELTVIPVALAKGERAKFMNDWSNEMLGKKLDFGEKLFVKEINTQLIEDNTFGAFKATLTLDDKLMNAVDDNEPAEEAEEPDLENLPQYAYDVYKWTATVSTTMHSTKLPVARRHKKILKGNIDQQLANKIITEIGSAIDPENGGADVAVPIISIKLNRKCKQPRSLNIYYIASLERAFAGRKNADAFLGFPENTLLGEGIEITTSEMQDTSDVGISFSYSPIRKLTFQDQEFLVEPYDAIWTVNGDKGTEPDGATGGKIYKNAEILFVSETTQGVNFNAVFNAINRLFLPLVIQKSENEQ